MSNVKIKDVNLDVIDCNNYTLSHSLDVLLKIRLAMSMAKKRLPDCVESMQSQHNHDGKAVRFLDK